jgi:hypothetical protein
LGFVVVLLFFSLFSYDNKGLSVFGQLFLGDFKVGLGADSLGSATIEGFLGSAGSGVGISNFLFAEFEFGIAFLSLFLKQIVVCNLFFSHSGSEIIEELQYGFEWASSFHLGFNLRQEGQNGSLRGEAN